MYKTVSLVLLLVFVLRLNGCGNKQASVPSLTDDTQPTVVTRNESENNAVPNQWGITLSADNVTPKGLTIVCCHSGGENVAQLQTGSYYVLQKLEDENWVDVEHFPQEHPVGWTMEAWEIQKESTAFWDVNWEWLYGELPAGEYRIGKVITNFRATGDYDEEICYAAFVIA